VAVLDLTDPAASATALHRAEQIRNPGSVGKVVVLLAWMQALADRFPDDPEARARFLRETRITADEFIVYDHHEVPFWSPGEPRVEFRPIRKGDTANLYTWLDWMCSASANAAAAMLQKHLMLLARFGEAYPVEPGRAERFFEETPREELGRILARAMQEPVRRSGLDTGGLRQGAFFTRTGKQRVPGTTSHATASGLLDYLVRMEQGRLVDPWSSREIKRLLYLTERRIRYASHPGLSAAAVVYKSGSLYSCRPEPGYECGKYEGNRWNFLNSMGGIENVPGEGGLHYLVVVLSNVLKKNSVDLHRELGGRIHELIRARHPDVEPASPPLVPEILRTPEKEGD